MVKPSYQRGVEIIAHELDIVYASDIKPRSVLLVFLARLYGVSSTMVAADVEREQAIKARK